MFQPTFILYFYLTAQLEIPGCWKQHTERPSSVHLCQGGTWWGLNQVSRNCKSFIIHLLYSTCSFHNAILCSVQLDYRQKMTSFLLWQNNNHKIRIALHVLPNKLMWIRNCLLLDKKLPGKLEHFFYSFYFHPLLWLPLTAYGQTGETKRNWSHSQGCCHRIQGCPNCCRGKEKQWFHISPITIWVKHGCQIKVLSHWCW